METETLIKEIWKRTVKELDYYDDKENYKSSKKIIKIAIDETIKEFAKKLKEVINYRIKNISIHTSRRKNLRLAELKFAIKKIDELAGEE